MSDPYRTPDRQRDDKCTCGFVCVDSLEWCFQRFGVSSDFRARLVQLRGDGTCRSGNR